MRFRTYLQRHRDQHSRLKDLAYARHHESYRARFLRISPNLQQQVRREKRESHWRWSSHQSLNKYCLGEMERIDIAKKHLDQAPLRVL